jgi:hypothetical protein
MTADQGESKGFVRWTSLVIDLEGRLLPEAAERTASLEPHADVPAQIRRRRIVALELQVNLYVLAGVGNERVPWSLRQIDVDLHHVRGLVEPGGLVALLGRRRNRQEASGEKR